MISLEFDTYPDFIANTELSEKMFSQFQRSLGIYGNDSLSGLDWGYNEFLSFVLLDKNAGKQALSVKMEKYKELINNEAIKDLKYSFQPVSDIYLKSGEIEVFHFSGPGMQMNSSIMRQYHFLYY